MTIVVKLEAAKIWSFFILIWKGTYYITGCSGWGNYYKNYHYNLSFK